MSIPLQTPVSVSREIAGRTLTIESGRIGRQASGSAMVRMGDTVVFVAATDGPGREGQDFFPLTVDYREGAYAAGKIPGGFFKREGRPTTKETLTSRLMDRPLRPLFPKGYHQEVSVQAMVVSAEPEVDPDILAIIGASAALSLAGPIPFQGPIGAVRMGMVDVERRKDETGILKIVSGKIIPFPSASQIDEGDLELTVAGTRDAITMVEAGANEVPEDYMLDALFQGHEVCREIASMIDELVSKSGIRKEPFEEPEDDHDLLKALSNDCEADLRRLNYTPGKHARAQAISELKKAVVERYSQDTKDKDEKKKREHEVKEAFELLLERVIRTGVTKQGKRNDGRGLTDIRPISTAVSLLPRAHGSALFTRGETQ
ncbi:polyribonucleotide nucleotidyltransferase, partial [bacterium]|nr:polyribonucleotide nucleotidyltransferase [bacterium]